MATKERKSKLVSTEQAVAKIKDGDRVMIGGFGLRGCPFQLVNEVAVQGQKDLTVIAVGGDSPGVGIGVLLRNGQISKMVGSHYNANTDVSQARNSGKITVDLMPMGNFAEAIRAGGMGIPAFYVPVSVGTELGEGKEIRDFNGCPHVLIHALKADVALVRAKKADALGNLVYSKTARNFNPAMATAAGYTIALVDEIVEAGELDPDTIITSHIYVDALVRVEVDHD